MTLGGGLLAYGFLNPLLLGGLGLVAVPIIIHWLFRRRYRRIDWAAMRFVLEAERENRRRVQLEQWLLLALRILVMALLALILTRPFVQPGWIGALLGGASTGERIIVIDDSASLSHQRGATSDFERARRMTDRVLTTLASEGGGGPVTLLLTSQGGEPWYTSDTLSTTDLVTIQQRLAEHAPQPVAANPRALFEQIRERRAQREQPPPVTLYVLSDFQATEWAAAGGSVFAPLEQVGALRVVLGPVVGAPRDNTAILDLGALTPHAIAGQATRFQITLANYGPAPSAPGLLEFAAADASLPALEIPALAPGETRAVEHELAFADPGVVGLHVRRAAGDGLALDDQRWLTVPVHAAIRVLLVNGDPSPDVAEDEVFLLSRALAPPGQFSSGILVDTIDQATLDGHDLNPYDVIMLCNPAPLAEAGLVALRRAVQQGAGLFCALGDNALELAALNRQLYAAGDGLLSAALEAVTPPGESPVGMLRTTPHPITLAFPAAGEGLSEYVRFRQFVRVTPETVDPAVEAEAGAMLAHFSDADQSPAFVVGSAGRGRTLLFTSTVDLDWNNWAASVDGSYVITMLEVAHFLARRDVFPRQLTAGQPFALPLPIEQYEPTVVVRPPNYPAAPAAALTATLDEDAGDTALALARGDRLMQVGLYEIDLAERAGDNQTSPLSVNVPASEADLRRAPRNELSAALGSTNHVFLDGLGDAALQAGENRRELWRSLLVTLVALLLLEQFLAWWFGRQDRRQPTRPRALWQT